MKKDEIPYDGFGNVIEMLHHADAAFREKILRNIAKKDPALAQRLLAATRASLTRNDSEEDHYTRPDYQGIDYARSQETLDRTQRSIRTRNYGR